MPSDNLVDTTGLTRAQVLCALFNGTIPRGFGRLVRVPSEGLTIEAAQKFIATRDSAVKELRYYFDYVGGRPLKVDLSDENSFDPRLYDRDAGGPGSAKGLIERLRFKLSSD